jgi:nuclear transport factor 2 (NTF2) superfamily protein
MLKSAMTSVTKPTFIHETALAKVKAAENIWNSSNPESFDDEWHRGAKDRSDRI